MRRIIHGIKQFITHGLTAPHVLRGGQLAIITMVFSVIFLGYIGTAFATPIYLDITVKEDDKLVNATSYVRTTLRKNVNAEAESWGKILWIETHQNYKINNGKIQLELGSITPLEAEDFVTDNISFVVSVGDIEGNIEIPIYYVPLSAYTELANTANSVDVDNITNLTVDTLSGEYFGITGLGTLVTALNVSANMAVNETDLLATSDGVGIGTDTLDERLTVKGGIRLSGGGLIFPDGTRLDSFYEPHYIDEEQTSVVGDLEIAADEDDDQDGSLYFEVSDVSALTLTVSPNAYVGIGTSQPTMSLDVSGAVVIRNSSILQEGSIRFNNFRFQGYDGDNWKYLDITEFDGAGWNNTGQEDTVYINAPDVVVGIGVENPQEKLEVAGTVSANYFYGDFEGNGSLVTSLNISNFGTVPVDKGGLGRNEFDDYAVLSYHVGNGNFEPIDPLENGELMIGTGGHPEAKALTEGTNIAITRGAGSIEVAMADSSNQVSILNNTDGAFRQLTTDASGHITRVTTVNLTERYAAKDTFDDTYLMEIGGTFTGGITFNGVTENIKSTGTNSHILIIPETGSHVGIVSSSSYDPIDQMLTVDGGIKVSDTTESIAGSIRYDSGSDEFQGFNGTAWISLDRNLSTARGWTLNYPEKAMYVTDPSSKVGIRDDTPDQKIVVVGDSRMSQGDVTISDQVNLDGSAIEDGSFSGDWDVNSGSLSQIDTLKAEQIIVNGTTSDKALYVDGDAYISGAALFGSLTYENGITVNGINFDNGSIPQDDWSFNEGELTNINTLSMTGLTMSDSSISTSENFSIRSTGNEVVLGKSIQFSRNSATVLTNTDYTMSNLFLNNAIVVEESSFSEGNLSIPENLVVSRNLDVVGDLTVEEGGMTVQNSKVLVHVTTPTTNSAFEISGNVVVGDAPNSDQFADNQSNLSIQNNLVTYGDIVVRDVESVMGQVQAKGSVYIDTVQANGVAVGKSTTSNALLDILSSGEASDLAVSVYNASDANLFHLTNDGKVGLATHNASAFMTIAGGTTSVPAIVVTSSDILATPVEGGIEYDGSRFYFSDQNENRVTVSIASEGEYLRNKRYANLTIDSGTTSSDISLTNHFTISDTDDVTFSFPDNPFNLSANNIAISASGNITANAVVIGDVSVSSTEIRGIGRNLYVVQDIGDSLVLNEDVSIDSNLWTHTQNQNINWSAYSGKSWVVEGTSFTDGDLRVNTLNIAADLTVLEDMSVAGAATITGNVAINTNLFVVNTGTGQVSIGTTTPTENAAFQVDGTVVIGKNSALVTTPSAPSLFVDGVGVVNGAISVTNTANLSTQAGRVSLGGATTNATLGVIAGEKDALLVENSDGDSILFVTNEGFVGINLGVSPTQSLTVTTINATYVVAERSDFSNVTVHWQYADGLNLYITKNIGFKVDTPESQVHIAAGTTSVPSLVMQSGTLVSTPIAGALENDGDFLYLTDSDLNRKEILLSHAGHTLTNTTFTTPVLGSNHAEGLWETTGALQLGDGGDSMSFNSQNWSTDESGQGTFNTAYLGDYYLEDKTVNVDDELILTSDDGEVAFEGVGFSDNAIRYHNDADLNINAYPDRSVSIESITMNDDDLTIPGELTIDTRTLFVKSSHVVGFGTNSPFSITKMQVSGNSLFGTSNALISTTGSGHITVDGNVVYGGKLNSLSGIADLSGVSVSRNVIIGTGGTAKLGIHTATPQGAFHIVGTSNITSDNALLVENSSQLNLFNVRNNGAIGISSTPKSYFEVQPQTSSIPGLHIPSGNTLTTPQPGAIEMDGNFLYYTLDSGTRNAVINVSQTATFNNKTLVDSNIENGVLNSTFILTGNLEISGDYALTLNALSSSMVIHSSELNLEGSGSVTFNKVGTLYFAFDGNDIESNFDDLEITPVPGKAVYFDDYIKFDGNEMTFLKNNPLTINAFVNRDMLIENTNLDGGNFVLDGDLNLLVDDLHFSTPITFNVAANQSFILGMSGTGGMNVSANGTYITADTLAVNKDDFVIKNHKVGIGTSSPAYTLDVSGNVKLVGGHFIGNGSRITNVATEWSENPNHTIYYDTNFVGLGISAPQSELHISSGNTSNPPVLVEFGNLMSSPMAGAIENDGTNLYITDQTDIRRIVSSEISSETYSNKTFDSPVITGVSSIEGTVALNSDITLGDASDDIDFIAENWSISAGTATFTRVTSNMMSITQNTIQVAAPTIYITPAAGEAVVLDNYYKVKDTGLTFTGGSATITTNGSITLEDVIFSDDTLDNVSHISFVESGEISGLTDVTVDSLRIIDGVTLNAGGMISDSAIVISANETGKDIRLKVGESIGNGNIYNKIQGSGSYGIYMDGTPDNTFTLESDGQTAIGLASPQGSHLLTVDGTVTANSFYGNGGNLTGIGLVWQDNGNGGIYVSGNYRIGIHTETPVTDVHIQGEDGFGAEYVGSFTSYDGISAIQPLSGVIPTESAGVKMMWYPGKATLIAGVAPEGSTNYEDSNIGIFAVSFGQNSLSKANGGVVLGGINNSVQAIEYSSILGGRDNTIDSEITTIMGGRGNQSLDPSTAERQSVLLGGRDNTQTGQYLALGGGYSNELQEDYSTILGGRDNYVHSTSKTQTWEAIGGGYSNSLTYWKSIIVGGYNNSGEDLFASIGGGHTNQSQENYQTIGGGYFNTADADSDAGTIGGGRENTLSDKNTTILGGYANDSEGESTVLGGFDNNILSSTGDQSAIGGGNSNNIYTGGSYSLIVGGLENEVNNSADYVTIFGGGYGNLLHNYSVIGGGFQNTMGGGTTQYSAIGGGTDNYIKYSPYSSVVGGHANKAGDAVAESTGVSIGGGSENRVSSNRSTIVGGEGNYIAEGVGSSFIGGGQDNEVVAGGTGYNVILGGLTNSATSTSSVLGGKSNVGESFASIPGGRGNDIDGGHAVAAGQDNTGSGEYSLMLGRNHNIDDDNVLAAGYGITASGGGSKFIWVDSSAATTSNASTDTFTVRADGGVWFFSDPSNTAGVVLESGSGAWASVSDRDKKENLEPVDTKQVAKDLSQLEISQWNYKTQDSATVHMGPMAQDFKQAYDLGSDNKSITTVDADGVILASIQGIYLEWQEKNKKVEELTERYNELKRKLAAR